ncbi:MAG: CAP domain-containing protein [Solirubrobacteraceae bacterium]|nr:CAP domain-containing protein [Solirubrobacteraceae bacterium]
MSVRAATAATALILAALAAAPSPASALSARACPGAQAPVTSAEGRHAVRCLLNATRAARGLPRLRASATLALAARRHARAMARRDFFDHVSPGGSTPRARAARAGYAPAAMVGETIAWGSGDEATALGTVRRWLGSPEHDRILLDRRLRDVGIGSAAGSPLRGSAGGATVVADLGRR